MKNTLKVLFLLTVFLGQACSNPCQKLCVDIQNFAKEEQCEKQFTNEEMKECLENQGQKTSEEKDFCAEARPQLKEKWTCENLEVFLN